MPILQRHRPYSKPDYQPLALYVPGLLEESETLDQAEQAEQNAAWFADPKRTLKDLAELALALAGVGAVVLGLWLAKGWG